MTNVPGKLGSAPGAAERTVDEAGGVAVPEEISWEYPRVETTSAVKIIINDFIRLFNDALAKTRRSSLLSGLKSR
jgi:hypothetical protein